MTEQGVPTEPVPDEQARHESWISLGIRTDMPHPARVYNYLLGGKDHFAADRDAAEMSLSAMPEIRDSAMGNRRFLARAVRYLSGEAGVRQFLDIGTGLPASPNTHELAEPGSRVVYVDNDPPHWNGRDARTAGPMRRHRPAGKHARTTLTPPGPRSIPPHPRPNPPSNNSDIPVLATRKGKAEEKASRLINDH